MRRFEQIIKSLAVKQNIVNILEALLHVITITLVIFNTFFLIFNTTLEHRFELFLFALSLKILLALIFIYYVLQTNRKLISYRTSARYLDIFNEDSSDTYQNAYELKNSSDDSDKEILERIYQRADNKAADQIIKSDNSRLGRIIIPFLVVTLISIAFIIVKDEEYRGTYDFFKLQKKPDVNHKESVEVYPGSLDMVRNSRLEIEVLDPESSVEHKLFYKIDKSWREETLSDHKRVFPNLDYSFSYYVKTPYAVSDTFQIRVFELPAVRKLDLKYEYPVYTRLEQEFKENSNGIIKAIAGTEVVLNLEVNNPIEEGHIIFSNGEIKELERMGRAEFRTSFTLEVNGEYHFDLVDLLGNKSEKIVRSFTVIQDKEPEIKILYPGRDTLLTQNMLLPLKIYAADDFGLKNLVLKFDVNSSETNVLPISEKITEKIINFDYILDLTTTFLIPGDKVTYWVEISDNSPQVQTVSSRRYIAKFPSIEEIYQEIEREEQAKSDMLENTLERSEELQKEFSEKQRELMKKEEFDWEDKKELEEILKQQEQLNENIENVAEEYQNLLEKFENNKALSNETLQKMEQIRELMEDIANDDLLEAMENMRKNLEDLDPEVMKDAMQNFKFSMEEFSQKLEQTLELLKAIKKEQAVQKSLEIAEEMEEMQSNLNERTSEGNESNEKLAEDQKAIEKKLESLKEQLEKTSEMMDPQADKEMKEALEELLEQMEQDSLAEDLQDIQEDLKRNNMESAQNQQQQAMEKMEKMTSKLSEMQQSMASGMMMEMGEIIEKTIKRLLLFSQKHEISADQYTDDPFLILYDQIALFESVNLSLTELYSTPMIILALGPKFIYDANFTNKKYQELFTYINEAKKYNVKAYLKDIQKGLNLMVYDLILASNNMQQGGGGGGSMQSLMQSMQQMGQQQMMMNMMTMELMQKMGEGGRLTGEMLQESQRLAAEEQRLADNMKRMLQNDPEAQKQTSTLNRIIEDLEAISRNLSKGRINQNIIDQQERILSRLLDAQRSIHKREFSKKRKAETSEIDDWDVPEEIKLKFDKLRQKALLNEDYKDFPKEYRELIEEYMKLLNEKANEE